MKLIAYRVFIKRTYVLIEYAEHLAGPQWKQPKEVICYNEKADPLDVLKWAGVEGRIFSADHEIFKDVPKEWIFGYE